MAAKGKAIKIKGTLTFGIIGDEATVTGLLLTGIGERSQKYGTNFLIVDKDTPKSEIEAKFTTLTKRDDIGIIFISQSIALDIKELITAHSSIIPTVLEIPSKDIPYNPTEDSVLLLAARQLYGAESAMEKLSAE